MGIRTLTGEGNTTSNGFVATGKGVDYVRLASLRDMLRLEAVGLASCSGPLRPRIAAEFGLKPRAKYADFIKAIEAKMAESKAVVQKENEAEQP